MEHGRVFADRRLRETRCYLSDPATTVPHSSDFLEARGYGLLAESCAGATPPAGNIRQDVSLYKRVRFAKRLPDLSTQPTSILEAPLTRRADQMRTEKCGLPDRVHLRGERSVVS